MINEIKERIKGRHPDDDEQLEVIFSEDKMLIIEAPPGYGKTRTMISKIAYLIASNQLPNPKKILALTFSVNAAYKIKKDVSENLPKILKDESYSPLISKNKVFASNYHGFCRRVLNLYGYLINDNLKNINTLKGIDDKQLGDIGLSENNKNEIIAFHEKIKEKNSTYLKENQDHYLEIIKEFFLSNGYITFNAILMFVLDLFDRFPEILKFYKIYFPIIVVDEFQDTNILSWELLQKLIGENTQLILMGDSFQQIYGFIGAIPGIMSIAKNKYDMNEIELKKNHRFKENDNLSKLDKIIRENAKNLQNPDIQDSVEIKVIKAQNQTQEANMILNLTNKILDNDPNDRIAILVRQRNNNTIKILETFESIGVFNALFTDEEPEYIEFHQKTLELFINLLETSDEKISKNLCKKFLRRVDEFFENETSSTYISLLKLLHSFLKLVFNEYNFLTMEEKIYFIRDVLENRALKQYLGHVNSSVLISTVHGAKGLEWDHVILPDVEKNSFPSWFGCEYCNFSDMNCNIDLRSINEDFEKKLIEELNLFYVGSTRGKKETYFSFSETRLTNWGRNELTNHSCFLDLKGINVNYYTI